VYDWRKVLDESPKTRVLLTCEQCHTGVDVETRRGDGATYTVKFYCPDCRYPNFFQSTGTIVRITKRIEPHES
jgi:hypothetical protein